MKISQMLHREDFYIINQKTLDKVFNSETERTELFIYPQLNAIVTRQPGKAVRQYLHCEYSVSSSNILRKVAVAGYVSACMHFCGILAAKKIVVHGSVSNEMLIYPCNKKYRIFDFEKNIVSVRIKDGFSDVDLKREIAFRTQQKLPDFVPRLVSSDRHGYTERIIDGIPLARINEGFDQFRDKAYALLLAYARQYSRLISVIEYSQQLKECIMSACSCKVKDRQALMYVVERLTDDLLSAETIELVFSHGDLQAGNIWIEKATNQVYIIDWESWGERSIWYDRATLYDKLRPGSIVNYLKMDKPKAEKAAVLLEDILFQLTELNNLPSDLGCELFSNYISQVVKSYETRTE